MLFFRKIIITIIVTFAVIFSSKAYSLGSSGWIFSTTSGNTCFLINRDSQKKGQIIFWEALSHTRHDFELFLDILKDRYKCCGYEFKIKINEKNYPLIHRGNGRLGFYEDNEPFNFDKLMSLIIKANKRIILDIRKNNQSLEKIIFNNNNLLKALNKIKNSCKTKFSKKILVSL